MISKEVSVPVDHLTLNGQLVIPPDPKGLILFVHGSGSSRHSPRNKWVAGMLNKSGFSTLLFDLLSESENRITENRFDIHLLTERLVCTTGWIAGQKELRGIPIGYFAASTGAAAALNAAAKLGYMIKALVSRGGRTDLALLSVDQVVAPVLLLVGENDLDVLELNQRTLKKLVSEKQLKIIPGASHLFEEPGKLDEVAHAAAAWFEKYLIPENPPR